VFIHIDQMTWSSKIWSNNIKTLE